MNSDFSKRIKEIANSYAEEPSPAAWGQIEKRLTGNHRKLRGLHVLSIAAIIITLFVSLFVVKSYLPNSDPDIRYIKNLKNLEPDQAPYAILVHQLNEAYDSYTNINEGFKRNIRVK